MAWLSTHRPISAPMLERGARALWNHPDHLERDLCSWEHVPAALRMQYQRQAYTVLDAALPQDPIFLRNLAHECEEVARIVQGHKTDETETN